jgi:hypothetical protein
MTLDAKHWELRGPVRSMRSEIAEWDPERQAWKERRFAAFVVFDGHGRVTQQDHRGAGQSFSRIVTTYDEQGRPQRSQSGVVDGANGAATTWRYDDRGRLDSIVTTSAEGAELGREQFTYDEHGRKSGTTDLGRRRVELCAVDGSDRAHPGHGAVLRRTRYDEGDRPLEVELVDAAGTVVQRVVMQHDAQGRLLSEETWMDPATMVPRRPGMPEEDYRKLEALIAHAWDSTRTTYEYEDSRLVSQRCRMGRLSEQHATLRYDEHGNLLERTERDVDRGMNVDEDGTPRISEDTVRVHQMRASYVYDEHGNWTERVFSYRTSEDAEYQPGNGEWRMIEYYDTRISRRNDVP